jgi:excisionase family DNA binding protein
MLSLPEAARKLGVAPATLRQQIKNGKMTATKLSRDWYVTPEEVERYRRDHLRDGKAA